MNLIPEPLHPAVVHFPIVLILLGGAAAVVAAIWRGGHLPRYAALLLVLGAVGAWVAVETGESSGGLLETGSPQMEALVESHEMWAKRTLTVTIVAAVAAMASIVAARWPGVARGVAILAAAASVAAIYSVYQTGHRGGALVYRHAAGRMVAGSAVPTAGGAAVAPAKPAGAIGASKARDDD